MSDQTVSTLQLVKRKDADSSDIDLVDLLSLPTELQYQGWKQALPQPGASSVDEVVTLLMNAGNSNTLATALQAIDTKNKETQWAQDPLNPIGVWLRSQLQGETGQRQSFILEMSRPQAGLGITDPLAYQNIIPDYGLGIKRMPVWENVLAQSITSSAISIHGGTVSYTVPGDAHGRVAQMVFSGGGAITPYYEAWAGVKSGRYGVNPANFVPVWNLHAGHLENNTTAVADATALDGTNCTIRITSTPSMNYRSTLAVSTVTANTSDQRGKYIVLLRAKTEASSMILNVRVGNGYYSSTVTQTSFAFQPRVQIGPNANTGWKYYTLGQVKIPSSAGFFNQSLDASSLAIQAEYVSGGLGGFDGVFLDNLILIPAEHSVHVAAPAIGFGFSGAAPLYVLTRPDKRMAAITYASSLSDVFEAPAPDAIDWSIPSGSGVIVCACSRTATAVSDTVTPSFSVYPSYNSLRGSV